jgi:hypothetical protein
MVWYVGSSKRLEIATLGTGEAVVVMSMYTCGEAPAGTLTVSRAIEPVLRVRIVVGVRPVPFATVNVFPGSRAAWFVQTAYQSYVVLSSNVSLITEPARLDNGVTFTPRSKFAAFAEALLIA